MAFLSICPSSITPSVTPHAGLHAMPKESSVVYPTHPSDINLFARAPGACITAIRLPSGTKMPSRYFASNSGLSYDWVIANDGTCAALMPSPLVCPPKPGVLEMEAKGALQDTSTVWRRLEQSETGAEVYAALVQLQRHNLVTAGTRDKLISLCRSIRARLGDAGWMPDCKGVFHSLLVDSSSYNKK